VNTIPTPTDDGRRRRRRHSPEFKAHVVSACCKPGVSMASVALANGVNANLVRRWVVDADACVASPQRSHAVTPPKSRSAPSSFVPVQLPAPPVPADIRVELTRGPTKIAVTWPASAAADCAAWMREMLR
jgi:transposase